MYYRLLLSRLALAALLPLGLSGCGGGSGGDGGDGGFHFGVHARSNTTAEDLLDHWNDPERLQSALGLSAAQDIDGKRVAIAALLASAGGNTALTGTKMRNIRPEDIEIIGERNGIAYGQWKGGPAGTLHIEFDWRFAENLPAGVRARMDRAGKSWSHRILDDFGTHEVSAGTTIRHGETRNDLDGDVETDGVLIFVLDKGSSETSSGGWQFIEYEYSDYDLEPWLGSIELSRDHRQLSRVMAHEIGHVLGIFVGQTLGVFTRYANFVDHTFEGPEAMRANGNAPVPFQWITADLKPANPGARGAEVDYGHPGVCSSVMAYCSRDADIIVSRHDRLCDSGGSRIRDPRRADRFQAGALRLWRLGSLRRLGRRRGAHPAG